MKHARSKANIDLLVESPPRIGKARPRLVVHCRVTVFDSKNRLEHVFSCSQDVPAAAIEQLYRAFAVGLGVGPVQTYS